MRKIFIILISYFLCIHVCEANTDARKQFIHKYKDIAIQEMQRTGIPASIKLAQAILESGNGQSHLAKKANNHFGIKCHDWTGATIYRDDDKANECFRKYKNPKESWVDHSDFLCNRPRYASLFNLSSTDYKGWATGLKQAGYATAPDYHKKLIKIIEDEKLHQYDKKPSKKSGSKIQDARNYKDRVVYINNLPCIKVQDGDSFESISKYFGIPLKKLLAFNDKNETSMKEGMNIFLKKKKNKAPKGYKFHKVRQGDSMYTISQIYGIKLSKLLQYNYMNITDRPQVNELISLRGTSRLY